MASWLSDIQGNFLADTSQDQCKHTMIKGMANSTFRCKKSL